MVKCPILLTDMVVKGLRLCFFCSVSGVKIEWSNDGELLAVGGFKGWPNLECKNELRLYNKAGVLRYKIDIEKKVRMEKGIKLKLDKRYRKNERRHQVITR